MHTEIPTWLVIAGWLAINILYGLMRCSLHPWICE